MTDNAFRRIYGAQPLHLLILVAGFALAAYVLITIGPQALWNRHTWWQSIAVWFAAAVIVHDLVLFPVYALLDRFASAATARVRLNPPLLNYLRIPALGAGLTFLVFLPGIIRQGAGTYLAATGQTQEPFLGRWLLLTAAMFAISAVVYGIRLWQRQAGDDAAADGVDAGQHEPGVGGQ
jgi:hypothetical protein